MGALFLNREAVFHTPTRKVQAVDSSGAGDAFIGTLAYLIAALPALPWPEKLARACEISTISVTRPGTQMSFPDKTELPATFFQLA